MMLLGDAWCFLLGDAWVMLFDSMDRMLPCTAQESKSFLLDSYKLPPTRSSTVCTATSTVSITDKYSTLYSSKKINRINDLSKAWGIAAAILQHEAVLQGKS